MKILNIITGVILIITASIGCSPHCDDEDYRKDSKSTEAVASDSLRVSSTHYNET